MKLRFPKTRWIVVGLLLGFGALLGVNAWINAWEASRVDLRRKLVGRWAADGSKDQFVAGGPVSISGAVQRVWTRSALGLAFDGTDARVTVPDSPDLAIRGAQDFSVTAWIQPVLTNNSFGVMSIVEKRKVGGIMTARGFSLHLEYGFLACQLAPAPGLGLTRADLLAPKRWVALWKARNALAPVNRFISTGPNLTDGEFHHVALTMDRGSPTGGKLWVDGTIVLTFNPLKARGSMANHEPFMIGTHPDTTLQCGFKGKIEDVRFYSRSLSAKEVKLSASAPETKREESE